MRWSSALKKRTQESELERSAAEQLEQAGYITTREESVGKRRIDIVGWAAIDGELRPAIAVEVKSSLEGPRREMAMAQLQVAAAKLGTSIHLVYDGSWYLCVNDFSSLDQLDYLGELQQRHPEVRPAAEGVVTSRRMVASALWRWANRLRDEGQSFRGGDNLPLARQFLNSVRETEPLAGIIEFDGFRIEQRAAARAVRDLASGELFGNTGRGEAWIPHDLSMALARLALTGPGSEVFVAHSRLGEVVWDIAELTAGSVVPATVSGFERWVDAAKFSEDLLRLAGFESISIDVDWPKQGVQFDLVVAAPPFGAKAPEVIETSFGAPSAELDVQTIDRCLALLRPGGRAVFHVSPSVLFGRRAAALRDWLTNEHNVVAIIGLPSGALFGTKLESAIVIVDRARPSGSTFVADLKDDWAEQLSHDGEVLRALLDHLETPS